MLTYLPLNTDRLSLKKREFDRTKKWQEVVQANLLGKLPQPKGDLKGINKKLKLFEITEVQLIESKSKDNKTIYKMEGVGHEKLEEIERQRKEAGRFILATNLVGDEKVRIQVFETQSQS